MKTAIEIFSPILVMLLTASVALALEWLLLKGILRMLGAQLRVRDEQAPEPNPRRRIRGA